MVKKQREKRKDCSRKGVGVGVVCCVVVGSERAFTESKKARSMHSAGLIAYHMVLVGTGWFSIVGPAAFHVRFKNMWEIPLYD